MNPDLLDVRRLPDGVSIWIHVTPRSRRVAVEGTHGDALRVAVAAAPAKGAANLACVEALASALGLARSAVALDPRARHRRKRVRLQGDPEDLCTRLRTLAAGGASD